MIPFLPDTESELTRILDKIGEAGVRRVTLSYLHLRPQIRDQLRREISPLHWKLIESCFHSREWEIVGSSSRTKFLPRPLREKGYERIRKIAKKFGIHAVICQCKNPDMRGDLCGSGRTAQAIRGKIPDQLPLFRC